MTRVFPKTILTGSCGADGAWLDADVNGGCFDRSDGPCMDGGAWVVHGCWGVCFGGWWVVSISDFFSILCRFLHKRAYYSIFSCFPFYSNYVIVSQKTSK